MVSRRRQRRQREAPEDSAPSATPWWNRHWATALILVAFAVVWTGLALGSVRQKSATYDEPLHLAAGYAAVAQGDFRVDPSHPPLIRMWAALPLLAGPARPLRTADIDERTGAQWVGSSDGKAMARRFLYGGSGTDDALRRSRVMIVPFGIGLGCLVFFWAREWLGLRIAVPSLALYALTPTILAHSALVTTDAGAAALTFAALYFLWRTCRRMSAGNIAGLVLSVAAAVLAKFSALALVPMIAVLLAASVRYGTVMTPRAALRLSGLIATVTCVAIWAAYGFRYAPSASTDWLYRFHDDPVYASVSPVLAGLTGWVDGLRLLPNAFTQGVLYCLVSAKQPAYLLGQHSADGWWYYFPVAFLVKTPLTLLVLVFTGSVILARHWRALGALNCVFVAGPAAAFLLLAIVSGINIGIRHLLPMYPFVVLLAAIAAERLWTSRSRLGAPALAAGLVLWLQSFATVYPNPLTYFNRAAGGPRGGLNYLADSNLDWGQHLPGLKTWMTTTGVEHINLAYFGQADPEHYGINSTYLPSVPWTENRVTGPPVLPGFVALSTTTLSGVYLPPQWQRFFAGFNERRPVAIVGGSIRIYWVEEWPDPPDAVEASAADVELALADGLQWALKWPAQSIRHYRAYLRHRPDEAGATERLGLALGAAGDRAAGLAALQRAVRLDGHRPSAHVSLAHALVDLQRPEEAESHAREATILAPGDAAAWQAHGRVLEVLGRKREALAQIERALQLAPANPTVRSELTRMRDRM
jgi:cytochrome c-type biogenesis protein CcmH/NrfG